MMHPEPVPRPSGRSPVSRLLLVALLFGCAALLRVDGLNEAPLRFHPARQYASALQARHRYYRFRADIPAWDREAAAAAGSGKLEPPVMEYLAVFGYLIAGGEHLWIPRLGSAVFWLISGACVFGIARRMAGFFPALAVTAFHLLLPFSVLASQSFQPNPLMVMAMLVALWLLVTYVERGSRSRLMIAAMVGGAAVLIMPLCAGIVLASFLALAGRRNGWRGLGRPATILVFLLLLVPPALYYGPGLVGRFGASGAAGRFVPGYLATPEFWTGTLKQIDRVAGLPFVLAGLLGIGLARPGPERALLIGMWAGYGTLCLGFDYHVSTHNYYHLPLIPIVALSLAPLVRPIADRLPVDSPPLRFAYGILGLAALLAARTSLVAHRQPPDQIGPAAAARIGRAVEHTTKAVTLDPEYGQALYFHGHFAGRWWPHTWEIEAQPMFGIPTETTRERFDALVRGGAQYFVVTELPELEAQPELAKILHEETRLVARGPSYEVFDLRAVVNEAAADPTPAAVARRRPDPSQVVRSAP